jgi:trimethylamine---corrinoid protein Co-methyltransferase
VTEGRNSGRRRRRSAGSEVAAAPAPAYLKRAAPPYEFLSEDSLQRIEDQADRLLAQVGIDFRDDPASLEYVKNAGADVRGERVRFPPGMCREIIQASAPRQFEQLARNPARNVMIGGDNQVFSPLYGAPFVRGLDVERRYATLEDFNTFVKLCQIAPSLHHSGGTICEPTDVPVSKRHLDMTYGHIRYSDKGYMGAVTSGWQAEDSIRMTEMVFGGDVVDANCCVLAMINPTSPLVYDGVTLETLRIYAAHNQGNVVTPFIIAGASGPVTPASMVAQLFAEAMAGMALAQLVRPGSPVIFGINSMGLNMRTGSPMRFDESWKCLLAAGQLSRRLGVPFRGGGSSSTSKIPDVHAGMESALYLNYSVLSGVNFLIHATGALELGLCVSFEKFVLDCEMLGVVSRVMGGMDVSDGALAVDAYGEATPGTTFLDHPHTLARYRNAFFESAMFDSRSFEQWRDDGSLDAASRANTALNSMLADYQAPPIDEAIDEALLDFMARRKDELPDSYA